ncbi:hypothetical protein F9278_36245 [Streptomyces phaeolivaceus]|uniref:Uncharacterized protein n=1 Tax=Streptomyces phaeolivaceus TaxID=2653200 RepID=A0A5P8KD65_9ACTN|nr:hypothetical protein [Streptomyces phaeolivaceus]QFR00729.1 hypothetical protein F9278_36245 [Streptomyces phaeolivaceus]
MLAYTVHDVAISCGIRELPPEDGWRCFESTGVATLTCSCGYTDGPMPKPLARLTAELHIHGAT